MKVIAFYTNDLDNRGPYYLSSKNKLDYIFSAFNSIKKKFTVLSLCTESKKKACACEKNEGICNVHYMSTYPRDNIVLKIFHLFFDPIKIFFFLLKNIERGDVIYLYHSTNYLGIFKLVKWIKKFKMILEVEEIYGDVSEDEKLRKKEISFFTHADAFVFPTELLNKKVNNENRPSAIIYGSYHVEEERNNNSFADSESIIHCVYAGTLDPRKGGALAAISSAEFLPDNYHLHILGFGSEQDTEKIKEQIKKVLKKTKAKVTYEGVLYGEDYIRFLQRCDIGLSTQNPEAKFNDTSFPSKILSYLSNGLRVVTVRIPVVEMSTIRDLCTYYEKQNPKEIADAILCASRERKIDYRKRIRDLSVEFENEILKLLKEI